MSKNGKRKRNRGLRIFAVVVALLCCVIIYKQHQLESEKKSLEKQYEELEEQYLKEQERAELLSSRFAYMQTIRYIEETAREKLGLVYKDEIILREKPEK